MITNEDGVRVSAKVKMKLLFKEYIESFALEIEDEWSKGDLTRLEDQQTKIMQRLNRNLVVKEEGAE